MATMTQEFTWNTEQSDVRTSRDGWLLCTRHTDTYDDTSHWCQCVRSIFENGKDAEHIWNTDTNRQDLKLVVPVMPSRDLWAVVRLETVRFMCKLFLVKENGNEEYLGLTSQGEGRFVWRTMIVSHIDWWLTQRRVTQCKSIKHGAEAEMQWRRDTQPDPTYHTPPPREDQFPQYWSIYMTGLCVYCANQSMSFDPNTSGLIPF
jgi:hypothetical protein